MKRLTLLALSVSVMTTGCATRLLGVKPAGQQAPSAAVAPNWKYGDPAPAGYGLATLTVSVPGAMRKTQTISEAGKGGADAELQVLLYVRRPSDMSYVYDAFGKKAVYVAPVDPATGKATFNLPPLPGTTLDPNAAATGDNSNIFEVRVYSRSFPSANAALQPLDQYQHLGDTDIDAYANLAVTKLVASGETLSPIVPGLPVVVNVPRLFVHVGDADANTLSDNLDAFSATQTKMVSLTNPPRQTGDEVLVRVTNVEPNKLAKGHKLVLEFTGKNGGWVTLSIKSEDGVVNKQYKVDTSSLASPTAVAGAFNTEMAGDVASGVFAGYYDYSYDGATKISFVSKTMSKDKKASATDESTLLAKGTIGPGVANSSASFDVTLTGSYDAYQPFNFSFTDAGNTAYPLYGVIASSAGLPAAAAALAEKARTDSTIKPLYDVTASGETVRFVAKSNLPARELKISPDVTGPSIPSQAAQDVVKLKLEDDALQVVQEQFIPVDHNPAAMKPWVYNVEFKTDAPAAGDTFIVRTNKPDGSPGQTFTLGATSTDAADTDVSTFLNNAATAANGASLGFPFKVETSGNKLVFTGNEMPGATIASVAIGSPAKLLGSTEATRSVGAEPVAASGQFILDPGNDDAADTVAPTDTVQVAFSWTDLSGSTRNVSVSAKRSELLAKLAADSSFADGFKAAFDIVDADKLKITADGTSGKIDPNSPSIKSAVKITRPGRKVLLAGGPEVASTDTNKHGLRALLVWPSGTTFGQTPPTLSVIDGYRLGSASSGEVGNFVKTLTGANASLWELTPVNASTGLTRLLDLDASAEGASAPTAGSWNFSIKLNGASKEPAFYLLDLDTANGFEGGVTVR